MVQLIVGDKGKGKTKYILDKVNSEIQNTNGNIVYLDKSTKHMFELNNKVRLIDVSAYMLDGVDAFLGFIAGIISQDHDLQQMYFDSFLKIAGIDASGVEEAVSKLEKLSEAFHVDLILSVSADEQALSASLKDKIIVSL